MWGSAPQSSQRLSLLPSRFEQWPRRRRCRSRLRPFVHRSLWWPIPRHQRRKNTRKQRQILSPTPSLHRPPPPPKTSPHSMSRRRARPPATSMASRAGRHPLRCRSPKATTQSFAMQPAVRPRRARFASIPADQRPSTSPSAPPSARHPRSLPYPRRRPSCPPRRGSLLRHPRAPKNRCATRRSTFASDAPNRPP